IRRSGATSLGDALRLAPNLMVIQGDQNQFVASARGGLAGLANKMLVLIDGRIVYSPLFSGVFSDAQDLVLADILRIEVISGPGSTLWGTNAVNGVINIITRPASATEGTLAVAYGGDKERGATVRFGAPLGEQGAYRLYAKYAQRDDLALASGASAMDASERSQAGFRADWKGASASSTLQGDVYTANVGNIGGPRDLDGGNLLGRWRRTLDSGSKLMLQAYYDRTRRVHEGTFDETLDTFDAEVLHTLRPLAGHEVSWGGEWRVARDRTRDTPALAFIPRDRTLDTVALFAQDQLAIAPTASVTLGVRAEHGPYTGLEWLPNLRLSWNATPDHLFWAALTRTVRAPSRLDRDLAVPGAPPFVIVPNDTFESEVANVAELGWRARVTRGATISLTAFHHDFRDLRTLEPGVGGLVITNGASGRVSGLEGWADWRVTPDWRLVGGFTAMHFDTSLEPGHVNLSDPPLGNNPRRTALLRSLWNVTPSHDLDLAWRYQGPLDDSHLPGYAVLDARLGWRVTPELDLSLIVRNALDKEHVEFPGANAQIGREWLVRATWSP
ncbi:MAG TPA: TonB-dependent receptor, partial [Usitatibacter sp.]|nr:TonB-dependent receptor [Usitatibacter sp.]